MSSGLRVQGFRFSARGSSFISSQRAFGMWADGLFASWKSPSADTLSVEVDGLVEYQVGLSRHQPQLDRCTRGRIGCVQTKVDCPRYMFLQQFHIRRWALREKAQ